MGRLKPATVLGITATVLLVGGGAFYLSAQAGTPEATAVAAAQPCAGACPAGSPCTACDECTGDCATCPKAVAATAAPASAADQAAATRKVPVVDADKCAGCAKCVRIAPKVYQMDPTTGKARVVNPQGADSATIQKSLDVCPRKAITRGQAKS